MRFVWKLMRRLGLALIGLAVLAALPVLWIESSCVVAAPTAPITFVSQLDPADRRSSLGTYYTYPEWAIVYAYQDLAAVARAGSESDYDYVDSVTTFWSGLCRVAGAGSRRAPADFASRSVLYVIGLSFTGEMLIKGAYEKSLGWVTAWLRGKERTTEDAFAQQVAGDYAAFLETKPWYEFPFGARLSEFWTTAFSGTLRGAERRLGLSLEWGGKALYAAAMRSAAGAAMPFSLRIRSVVSGLDDDDAKAVPGISRVATLADAATIIETGRYRTLTDVARGLASRGRNLREIAGNDVVLVSVLAKGTLALPPGAANVLFQAPVQGRAGVIRVGLEIPVTQISLLILSLAGSTTEFEMIYDFY